MNEIKTITEIKLLQTDSSDYDILYNACKMIKGVEGLTCEIGVRRGGGSSIIMGTAIEIDDRRVHIGIDPYGNIDYPGGDGRCEKFDYTNQMKMVALSEIYNWCLCYEYEFIFFNLEDAEFFKRFADGIPLYNEYKSLVNKYALVFFDGPHSVETILPEIQFFNERTPKGGMWIFDDISSYNHDVIEKELFKFGFEKYESTNQKASYKKI